MPLEIRIFKQLVSNIAITCTGKVVKKYQNFLFSIEHFSGSNGKLASLYYYFYVWKPLIISYTQIVKRKAKMYTGSVRAKKCEKKLNYLRYSNTLI